MGHKLEGWHPREDFLLLMFFQCVIFTTGAHNHYAMDAVFDLLFNVL